MPKTSKSIDEVTTLTSQAILDFQVCQLFYECRHIRDEHELVIGREQMANRFEDTLKKVATYFFHKKQGDPPIPSYNAILNRWERLWFPKDMDAYDMANEQHEHHHGNLASYSNTAVASFEAFHNKFVDLEATPVLVDEPFVVPIARGVRIEGRFDVVLRNSNGKYTIIKWRGRRGKRRVSPDYLDFALMKMAFEYRSDEYRPAEYKMYNLADTKDFEKVEQPSAVDVDALKYWALEAATTEKFVPRRPYTAYCKGCAFDSICLKFDDWPVK